MKGQCRRILQHAEGHVDIQNPDWIIARCQLDFDSVGWKGQDDRHEVQQLARLTYVYIFIFQKFSSREQHSTVSLFLDIYL